MRERTALAIFEEMRLLKLSRRVVRQPANSRTSAAAASRAASSLGMSAGSFWPSPSSVATHADFAARTPFHTAVLCPLRVTWCSTRNSGWIDFCAARIARLSSLESSST